jgi:hypothetical protein
LILTSIDPGADKRSVFVSRRTSKGSRCDVQSSRGARRRDEAEPDRAMMRAMIEAMIEAMIKAMIKAMGQETLM